MSDAGDNEGWSLSESKDWKDGRHRRTNRHVLAHAGEVSNSKTRRHLTATRSAYERAARAGWLGEGVPVSWEDLRAVVEKRIYHETESFGRRVEKSPEKLRAHVGSERERVDVSGWHDIERIRRIVDDDHLRLYEFGEPGSGKTSAGCTVARHWLEQREDRDPELLSNSRTIVSEARKHGHRATWVQNWPELEEILYVDVETVLAGDVEPRLFLFDEASSQASGSGSQGHEARTKLAVLAYKMRKYGCALVMIGHDGKDIHPALREMCIALHKTDKKEARFYQSVRNRKGVDPITPAITGWPDSMWSPNDKDPAGWAWARETSEDDEDDGSITRSEAFREIAIWTVVDEKTRHGDEGLSFDKIASRRLSGAYSGEWCRRRWNEYQDGEHGEIIAEIQQGFK